MIPKRILFIAEGQLGDLLLLTPALRAAKESFPQSFISVLVVERRYSDESKRNPFDDLVANITERQSSILSTNNNVDELLVLSRQGLRALRGVARVKAEFAIIRFLRRRTFDTVICTFPEDRFAQWAFASGAKVRIGQRKQGLNWLLTRQPEIEKSEIGVLQYYCDLVKESGAIVRSTQTEYTVPEKSRRWANDFLRSSDFELDRPIVAIHPGASGDYRIWPPERYALLMDRLAERGITVLLLTGLMDELVVNQIKSAVKRPFKEVRADERSNLAAIIQRCQLCISNDSGPRHLAIAVGTPSLAFFLQHRDREWGVYEESNRIVTLKGKERCPVCPAGICLDRIPEDERFGAYCLRMVNVDDTLIQIESMLSSR